MKDDVTNNKENNSTIIQGKKRSKNTIWLLQVFFISLSFSILFAIISELMLAHTNLAIALILIMFLIVFSVIFDVIGVAVTASNVKPLLDLKQQRVKGAEQAILIVKNADKVSCICTDVVGDICSILSGAGGATISIILLQQMPNLNSALLSITISAVIASIIILGKAIGKSYALNYPTKILIKVGRIIKIFSIKSKDNPEK